jgi:hypothetical protein
MASLPGSAEYPRLRCRVAAGKVGGQPAGGIGYVFSHGVSVMSLMLFLKLQMDSLNPIRGTGHRTPDIPL